MTPDQHQFVNMLEDKGLNPNIVMDANGKDWTSIDIDLRLGSSSVGLTFDPDGKLIAVNVD